jgi:uncharacterized protein (DUF305 family)
MNAFVKGLMLVAVAPLVVAAADAPKHDGARTQHIHEMKMTGDMPKDMRAMNDMMVKHLGKGDWEYEKRFIDMMIPHHEGAILMAEDALKNSNRAEIKDIARTMIEAQRAEIKKLKQLRDEWYSAEAAPRAK